MVRPAGLCYTAGNTGDGSRVFVYRDKAAHGLTLATVAASNDSEHNAVRLLTTHFNHVQKWSTALVKSRKSLGTANYSMSVTALNDDPLYQTITRCSRFLGTMLAGGKFEDDGSSCH